MKKYGEITAIDSNMATVRICEIKKNGESVSTAHTLTATISSDAHIGDMAELEINGLLHFLSTTLGYLFPAITGVTVHGIAAFLTDNLIIMQSAFMITLVLTYIIAAKISKSSFFKKLTVCTVTDIMQKSD